MSAGQIVGGIAGAVIGFFAGGQVYQGAVIDAQLGATIGGLIDPPKGPKVIGPRLSDLTTQTSTYGAVIPRVYGTVPIVGNLFWLENNQLRETSKTEDQGKGGSGPETTTFSYSATFAVGLCEGLIAGVRRIWVGANLIYDAGAVNIESILASSESASVFKVYNGNDTQQPDPRMQAALGVANTPAYRGLAYIVFYDYQLKDHGNSLIGAQVKVEVVKKGSSTFGVVASNFVGEVPSRWAPVPFYVSATLVRFFCPQQDGPYSTVTSKGFIYDVRVNSITHVTQVVLPTSDSPPIGNSDNPDHYFPVYTDVTNFPMPFQGGDGTYVEREGIIAGVNFANPSYPIVAYLVVATGGPSTAIKLGLTAANCCAIGDDGSIFLVHQNGVQKYTTNLTLVSSIAYTFSTLAIPQGHCDFYDGNIWLFTGDGACPVYTIDAGLTVVTSVGSLPANSGGASYTQVTRVIDGVIVRAWRSPVSSGAIIKDNLNVQWINMSSLTIESEILSDIVESEALKSNLLTAPDLDVSALTQAVRGYRVNSIAAIRAGLDPLIGAWPFDVIQHGYKISCKPRGGASVATIPVAKLDARAAGSAPGVQITSAREMDSVLPGKVSLTYFDASREYDTGEQYAERLNTQSVNTSTIEMALVLTADEAAQKAEILLYVYWLERYDVTFRLPPEYNYLEPSDVITITSPDANYQLRLTSINYTSAGWLECQAKYSNAATYTSTATGGYGTSTGQTLALAGPTQYELLDTPLMSDVFDAAGFPVAMSGYLDGWPGGILMRSDDDGQTWNQLNAFSRPGSTLGYATTSLFTHNGLLIDKASVLTVRVNQALSSATELQMLNGANHFAYGLDGRWEIIGAQNCVLQTDGSYVLTDLLRGRFGTEWATGLHAVNDHLVLMNKTSLQFATTSLNAIGLARTYRGITIDKTIESDSNRAFTYRAVNLKCLSPTYLNLGANPLGGSTLTWIRRTRKGGELRDLVDAPLSEATESYEIDVTDVGGTTVVSTKTATTPSIPIGGFQPTGKIATSLSCEFPTVIGANLFGILQDQGGSASIRKFSNTTFGYLSGAYIDIDVWAMISAGGFLYTASPDALTGTPGYVRKIDTSLAIVATSQATLAGDPQALVYASGAIWVAMPYARLLRKLNAATLAGVADVSLACSVLATDGTDVWAMGGGTVYKINGTTNAVVTSFAMPCSHIIMVGSYLYGINLQHETLLKYDKNTGAQQSFSLSITGEDFSSRFNYLNTDGRYLSCGRRSISVIDTTTDTVVLKPLGNFTSSAGFSGAGKLIVNNSKLLPVGFTELRNGFTEYENLGLRSGQRIRVYQMSATTGRGYPAEMTIP
jgi:Putative phage tail protein